MTCAHAARWLVLLTLTAATTAPAAAQIGGRLKKKVRAAAGVPEPAATRGGPTAGGETAGTLVLDDDVLERLMKGLRAGRAERDAAAKSDTPYGRHIKAAAAYAEAKSKCDAASRTFPQRMAANQRLMEKSNAYLEKMLAAQQAQDTALQRVYSDSMLAMQDPSCTVKEPQQPADWHNQERQVSERAEQKELESSGFDRRELGGVKDRVIAMLEDAPPPDASPAEQAAVDKRADELNRLMGREPPPAAAQPPQPAPAPTGPPPSPSSGLTAEQEAMNACMAKNGKKHEAEIERLGKRVQAAAESGNTQAAMMIADSIRQLQSAGCPGT